MKKQNVKFTPTGVTLPSVVGAPPSRDIAEAMVARYAAEMAEIVDTKGPLSAEQRARLPELRYAARVWVKLAAGAAVVAALSGCGAGVGFSHSLYLHRVDEMQSSQRTFREDNDTGISCLWRNCAPAQQQEEVVRGS